MSEGVKNALFGGLAGLVVAIAGSPITDNPLAAVALISALVVGRAVLR